ncbi:MAG: carboxypeptidase-like regulatory domain-containing protein [Pyrinomonadaceae bacterium]
MIKTFPLFLIFFFLSFAPICWARTDIACLPIDSYQELPYWQATNVFIGSVDKVTIEDPEEKLSGLSSSATNLRKSIVRFAVAKQFRGELGSMVEVGTTSQFNEGESYFVYAIRGNDGKLFKVSDGVCGMRPIPLKDAQDDIEYAEDIATGKIGTRIYGIVTKDSQETVKTPFRNIPMPDISVTIRNENETYTTFTDSSGKFVFKNVPKGTYDISVAVGDGLRERIIRGGWADRKKHKVFVGDTVLLRDMLIATLPRSKNEPQLTPKQTFQRADSYNFWFTSLGSIEGRLLIENGKLANKQQVALLPINESGKVDLERPFQWTYNKGENSEFVFDSVPEGKYRIAVNPQNCHRSEEPQNGRSFYPGVPDQSDPGIITVEKNGVVRLRDYRLPRQLKERHIDGVVLAPDRKPVAGATVRLMPASIKDLGYCTGKNVEVITDEKGRFRLKGYESYEYQISAYRMSNGSRQFSKPQMIPKKGGDEDLMVVVDSQY